MEPVLAPYYTHGEPGFEPAKAHTFKDTDPTPRHTWVEPKIDGARGLVFCTPEGVFITSRRKGVRNAFRQWQENLPHLQYDLALRDMGVCLFDGEVVMNSLSSTMSVIGANPAAALQYQEDNGWAKLVLFDCLVYNGRDMTNIPLHQRRRLLYMIKTEHISPIDHWHFVNRKDVQPKIEGLVQEGYEGAVVKDPNASYWKSRAWLKYKKTLTLDVVVTGFVPGKGKYTGQVGALKCSVYDTKGELVEICNVAPGDDGVRAAWTAFFKQGETRSVVIEVECQEWSVNKRLRHPRLLRVRHDLAAPNTVNFTGPPEVVS